MLSFLHKGDIVGKMDMATVYHNNLYQLLSPALNVGLNMCIKAVFHNFKDGMKFPQNLQQLKLYYT